MTSEKLMSIFHLVHLLLDVFPFVLKKMLELTENVLNKSKRGKHYHKCDCHKNGGRVGCLGSSIPNVKPCQKPHLVHESFDGPRHARGGSQAGLSGPG